MSRSGVETVQGGGNNEGILALPPIEIGFSTLRSCGVVALVLLLLFQPLSSQTSAPYRFRTSPDGWLAPAAGVLSLGAYLSSRSTTGLTAADLSTLNKTDIPAFDRWATDFSSLTVRRSSDVSLGVAVLVPMLVLTEFGDDYVELAGMYAETMALTWSVTTLLKSVGRIRPLAYNSDASLADRQSADMRESFPSGHTSGAMASMVFLATVYEAYRPGTTMAGVLWVGGVGLGLVTGSLRVFSGMHFPTDVLAGAVIGGVIGYVVPKLHEADAGTTVGATLGPNATPVLHISVPL